MDFFCSTHHYCLSCALPNEYEPLLTNELDLVLTGNKFVICRLGYNQPTIPSWLILHSILFFNHAMLGWNGHVFRRCTGSTPSSKHEDLAISVLRGSSGLISPLKSPFSGPTSVSLFLLVSVDCIPMLVSRFIAYWNLIQAIWSPKTCVNHNHDEQCIHHWSINSVLG